MRTAEACCAGEPSKVCDQVSDAVLDACLKDDDLSRVACECCCTTGMIMILGEITTASTVNYEAVIRSTLKDIGYDSTTMNVIVAIEDQSPDIARAISATRLEDVGAGDSCVCYGFATDETDERLPLPHVLAQRLAKKISELKIDWLKPDAKVQVTMDDEKVTTVCVSAHHAETASQAVIRETLTEVIRDVLPTDSDSIFHINPSGRFVVGGPHADAGMTGRHPADDAYGGFAPCTVSFSGKDPSKTERSGSYAARWVAVSLVAAGLAKRVQVSITYGIGIAYPIAVAVDSFGTSSKSNQDLLAIVNNNFDLRPGIIVRDLNLRRPIFQQTAVYGHFGQVGNDGHMLFPWDLPKTDLLL